MEKKYVYQALYLLDLKTIHKNEEYRLLIELLNGYPRLVVRKHEEKYPVVKVTFTPLGIHTLIYAMENVINTKSTFTIDSKNYKYTNGEKTGELESVGVVDLRVDDKGALVITVSHKGESYEFPVMLDKKFFTAHYKGATLEDDVYKLTGLAYIDLLKRCVSDMVTDMQRKDKEES